MIFSSVRMSTFAAVGLLCVGLTIPSHAYLLRFDDIQYTAQLERTLSSYDAIYIAPVEIALPTPVKTTRSRRSRGRIARPVSERDQTQKANDLYEDMTRQLERRFELASAPGPNVLTVRTTITELRSSRPTGADFNIDTNLSASSVYAGGAAASFTLETNGEPLVLLSDEYYPSLNDGNPRVGIWQDTDNAFRRWSRNLARFISRN